ncbi:hypothetical protein Microterr_19750 [Microbacterium terricola]|uniref:Secreted protein n=1 Tax=Microbacterium terricola TaxID=344163 RepID=A0ABM8E0G9_9MICO|nr:hypothetical protein Microterr_19750 [Microbacterium terricola]
MTAEDTTEVMITVVATMAATTTAPIVPRRSIRMRDCWVCTCSAFSRTASRRSLEDDWELSSLDMEPLGESGTGTRGATDTRPKRC